jgi:phage/conjugal plasmid C-4 type zinc finger TraR family protein
MSGAPAHRQTFAEAYKRRATLRLLQGDYRRGWEDYETSLLHARRHADGPLQDIAYWAGQPLRGKSILLSEPSGLGDTIQFWRFLPQIAAMGARISFLGLERMFRLLRSSPWAVRMLSERPAGEAFDYRCELWSLPRLLRTGLDDIPDAVPYLAADPDATARWSQWLGAGHFNIGVCWQGNPDRKIDAGRSIPLAAFAPLARVPGVRLVSLQKNFGLEQLDRLPAGMTVLDPGPEFDAGSDAFIDSAGLMQALDLVVTSDTSLAHLAGALGRPTWVGIKYAPEWRWLLDRPDSPWYPTLRLFRQPRQGDWAGVFDAMAPVGIEQERRRCAVGQAETVAGSPLASGHAPIQPGIGRVEHRPRLTHAMRIAHGLRAEAVGHDLLLRRGNVVVEEAVEHPHFQRGVGVPRDESRRPGMARVQVLDDAAGFEHRSAVVDQHREALDRPQRRQLLHGAGLFEHAVLERRAVLVQRDQHLLAVGGEGMGVEAGRGRGHGGSWRRLSDCDERTCGGSTAWLDASAGPGPSWQRRRRRWPALAGRVIRGFRLRGWSPSARPPAADGGNSPSPAYACRDRDDEREAAMATGWAGDNAVQDQIDATVEDAIKRARSQLPRGPGLAHCEECGASIPEARRKAMPGVRLCVACQETLDREQAGAAGYNRRGSKDSQLR